MDDKAQPISLFQNQSRNHSFLPENFRGLGFVAPNGTQTVGYPIAGKNNDLKPGHRRYNFVWYFAVEDGGLRAMLTGDDGTAPPPLALFTAALTGCLMT